MSKWTKLPPVEGTFGGCFNCGPRPSAFPMDYAIAVGFGYAALTKDGAEVWSESQADEYENCMTGAQAEALAAADPDHDWRIILQGPLSGREYQRQGDEEWLLVHQDMGFA